MFLFIVMVMKGNHEVYLFENIFFCNFIRSLSPRWLLQTKLFIVTWWKAYVFCCCKLLAWFINKGKCQSYTYLIMQFSYPFVFLFFFSPLLILFRFCSFIRGGGGGGGGRRGGIFALEFFHKYVPISICQCKENLASRVTSSTVGWFQSWSGPSSQFTPGQRAFLVTEAARTQNVTQVPLTVKSKACKQN